MKIFQLRTALIVIFLNWKQKCSSSILSSQWQYIFMSLPYARKYFDRNLSMKPSFENRNKKQLQQNKKNNNINRKLVLMYNVTILLIMCLHQRHEIERDQWRSSSPASNSNSKQSKSCWLENFFLFARRRLVSTLFCPTWRRWRIHSSPVS